MPATKSLTNKTIVFEEWMHDVDDHISNACGLTSDDLADQCYQDMYEDGMTSKAAAKKAMTDEEE